LPTSTKQQSADVTDPVGYLDYLTSSSFAVDVAENWQSEYLQLSTDLENWPL
jgi:Domain of unknown function (DUF6766)